MSKKEREPIGLSPAACGPPLDVLEGAARIIPADLPPGVTIIGRTESATCTGKGLSLDHIIPIKGVPPHGGGPLQNKRDEPATNLTTAGCKVNFAKGESGRSIFDDREAT